MTRSESWHRFFARFPLKRSNKYHARKYLSLFSPRLIKSTRYEARAKVFACYTAKKVYFEQLQTGIWMVCASVSVGSKTFHLPGAHLTRLHLSLLLAFFFHWIHNFSSFLAGNEHAGEFPEFKVEILPEWEISSFLYGDIKILPNGLLLLLEMHIKLWCFLHYLDIWGK